MELLYPANQIKTISKIINSSSRYLIICCPYWWQNGGNYQHVQASYMLLSEVLVPITRASHRGVFVVLMCHSKYQIALNEIFKEEISHHNLFVYSSDSFHCKLYLNESQVVITSKNLSNDEVRDFGVVSDELEKVHKVKDFVLSLISDYKLKSKLSSFV